MQYGMLIDYGYCTNCHSCEVSCRKEKDLPVDEWGIKVQEIGPEMLGDKWEWDYLPVPSRLCDLCADRLENGKIPACQLHCLAAVIEVLPLDEIGKRMAELDRGKVTCFVPSV